jgi:nicotinamidase-related amidase
MKNKNAKAIILVLAIALAYFYNENNRVIYDHYVVWRNPPSPAVAELADRTGMSGLGRRIFFASLPSIDDAADLNANCSDLETTMIILGCYARGRIHVFNVSDERITDAKYVTSAHEMLHAAYIRLPKGERDRINRLLEEAYHYASKNDELLDVMAEYAQVEPAQRYNELHSILGTEYAELYPELEKYYARYFADRRKIVDMAAQYRKVFKNLEKEQVRLKAQLDRMTVEIKDDSSFLETMIFWLNRDVEIFNAKQFRSRSEFDAEKEILLEREMEINGLKAQIDANINNFNKLVEEFNNLGGKIEYLNNQLDSKSQTGVRAIKDAN